MIAIGSAPRSSSWSTNPGTLGSAPLIARIPAGRGRPGPSPSAHAITAPWEKPPSTVRSIGTPGAGGQTLEPGLQQREGGQEGLGVGVPVLLRRVPVVPDRRQLQRPAREGADEPLARVEDVDQRRDVLLARAAAVEQDERARRLARREPQRIGQLLDVGHDG